MIIQKIRFSVPIALLREDELIVEVDGETGLTNSVAVVRDGVKVSVGYTAESDADTARA